MKFEKGFTLFELVVGLSVSSIVIFAALTAIKNFFKLQSRNEHTLSLQMSQQTF